VILDTCALLWLAQGGERLSESVRQRINAEAAIFVSAISGFEIGVKHQKGKLELPARPAEWFDIILEHHDLEVLSLDLAICVRAAELPRIHADPCDRLIIATAESRKMPVVTADPVFQEYGVEVLI
jgi:PIN domain nuclease of toxin-antitoxin system